MSARRESGLTLVELMVAMVLGLVVAAGVVTVFISTSGSQRVQTQLARLQEEGRFAVTRLVQDLRMANAQYCSNSGGVDSQGTGGVYLSPLRAPVVQASGLADALADLSTPWGDPYPDKPTAPYSFPSFLSMRGYDCDKDACTPAAPASLPEIGTTAGKRVPGTAVLTLRYLDASGGWALGGKSTVTGDTDGTLHHVTVSPGTGEPAINDVYKAGDLMVLADCSNAQIFSANLQSGAFYPDPTDGGLNLALPVMQQPLSAPRLFDFNHDFHTVTYYLEVVDLGDGLTTGALMRRDNGVRSEVVRGVERLDFRYGVEDASGGTSYLTASEIDDRNGGKIACPPGADGSGSAYGCLWRAVKSIEVHVLMNGQQRHGTLTANEQRYAYSIDGDTAPKAPDDAARAVTPADQGFDRRMLRREFNALVSVRNYNP